MLTAHVRLSRAPRGSSPPPTPSAADAPKGKKDPPKKRRPWLAPADAAQPPQTGVPDTRVVYGATVGRSGDDVDVKLH